ncbi:hypothetical protein DKK74_01220 [Bifidobacterium asteroides]|uniref:Uncharacterized protein n=1 Tax=Bifidobacterium asteroides TaxID=1684 RepID=A0A318MSF8_9BIFI|nr:hypothetical protein DKK74_01220 [Bifidobacterium asteroides]
MEVRSLYLVKNRNVSNIPRPGPGLKIVGLVLAVAVITVVKLTSGVALPPWRSGLDPIRKRAAHIDLGAKPGEVG